MTATVTSSPLRWTRTVTRSRSTARKLGFNRLSFGVQDFDEQVQIAVNRIQTEEQTRELVQPPVMRASSRSVDLIYGLPLQTVASFDATLSKIIDIRPTASPRTARTCRIWCARRS